MNLAIIAAAVVLSGSDHGHSAGKVSNHAQIVSKLTNGNTRFVKGKSVHPNQNVERRHEVAKSQHPHTIVLSCSDSRVSPEVVFDQGLGDLFVVRGAGNVVDTMALASMEYSAEHLGSTVLLIMGHERCGAVKAALDFWKHPGESEAGESNIPDLVSKIVPAVETAKNHGGDHLHKSIVQNVRNSAGDILHHSATLKKMVLSGKLKLMGGVYNLDSGKVSLFDLTPKGTAYVKVYD